MSVRVSSERVCVNEREMAPLGASIHPLSIDPALYEVEESAVLTMLRALVCQNAGLRVDLTWWQMSAGDGLDRGDGRSQVAPVFAGAFEMCHQEK